MGSRGAGLPSPSCVPNSASRIVPLSLARCVRPSSRGRVLPAPAGRSGSSRGATWDPAWVPPLGASPRLGSPHQNSSLNFPRRTRSRGCHPTPCKAPTSEPQSDGHFTCAQLVRSCSCFSRVRTQAPPGGTRAAASAAAVAAAAATATAAAAPAPRCSAAVPPRSREARSPAPAAWRAPAGASPPRLPAPGPHAPAPGSAPGCRLSQLRRAEDPPNLQDGRGFPPTGRCEGRELPSRSDRDGGRGFPCRNDKVGGNSPERGTPLAERPSG